MAIPISGEQPKQESFARVRAQLSSDPVPSSLDVQLVGAEAGSVVLRLPVHAEMNNALGILHGGFIFLLADTAFAYCGTEAGTPLVTHHANATYLAPVRSSAWIQAHAVVQRRYGRNMVCDVTVTDSDGNVVAEMRIHGVVARPQMADGA
jgi:acyl-CoA thioesterase